MSARWVPLQCDHDDCLRQAAEMVYLSNPARVEFLCEKHLPAVGFGYSGGPADSQQHGRRSDD